MHLESPLTERWWWLAGSLGIALIVGVVRWVLDEPAAEDAATLESFIPPGLYHALRLLYAVGIPAVALLWRGALTTRGLGLQPFHWFESSAAVTVNWADWVRDLGWVFALGMGTYIILKSAHAITRGYAPATSARHRDGAVALREAIYHQVHWAFYREPFVLLWGIQWGAWGGLLPVILEAAINPERWADLRDPCRSSNLLMRAGLAVFSVILYIQTQNLWLMILADVLLGWGIGQYPRAVTESATTR